MSATLPFDVVGVEDVLHDWVMQATGLAGDRIRLVQPWDVGVSRDAPPTVLIYQLSARRISEPAERTVQQVMQARVTVIADGPGDAGIDFYPGRTTTPQTISITAGPGDPPDVIAAVLLVQLGLALPAGYTAAADPGDNASILISGSASEPFFALAPADNTMTSTAVTIPRNATVYVTEYVLTYRIQFRTAPTNGDGQASTLMYSCTPTRKRYADARMRALGFHFAGTVLEQPNVPADREESQAVLDVQWRGTFTAAFSNTLMRVADASLSLAS